MTTVGELGRRVVDHIMRVAVSEDHDIRRPESERQLPESDAPFSTGVAAPVSISISDVPAHEDDHERDICNFESQQFSSEEPKPVDRIPFYRDVLGTIRAAA